MTDLQREIMNAGIIACIYISLFLIAEIIHRFTPAKPEISRKFVHFFGGITALSFPYLLKSHITALILAVGFVLILLLSKRKEGLKSIFGIERKSYGSILFPMAIYLTFLLGYQTPVLYFIAILTLSVSDAVAALIGKRYGSIRFKIEGETKSLEGSVSFFFVTFFCIHLPLLLMTDTGRTQSVLIALVISLLVTAFELISLAGSDNIFIPLGTYYIIAKMTSYPVSESYRLVFVLFTVVFLTLLIFWRVKSVQGSGVIGMVLLNFAAWTLCGFKWFLPLFLSEILFFLAINFYRHFTKEKMDIYHIKAVFYTTIIPAALIFITNAKDNQRVMYLPFLAANVSQAALICGFFLSRIYKERNSLNKIREFSIPFYSSLVSIAVVSLFPVILYQEKFHYHSILILFAASLLGFVFNSFITKLYFRKGEDPFKEEARFRIRMVSTALSVLFIVALQLTIAGHIEKSWML
jgi:phytol kinase